MNFTRDEIIQTIRMVQAEQLDIRTITLGISLRDCADSSISKVADKIYDKLMEIGRNLVPTACQLEEEFGIPIVNKRISVTPIALVAESCAESDYTPIARAMDKAAKDLGIDFIGGFSALVHKGFTRGDMNLLNSIPDALSQTERVCASVNVATSKAGINMDAVLAMGRIIKEVARLTANQDGIGAAKLVVFANAPEDNPFMAGAFHGPGEPETTINVGISGPGVVNAVLSNLPKDADLGQVSEAIKKMAFKITRVGELIGREASRRLGIPFGIIDLSLAPTPSIGDSIANILETMGLERCGAPGTTAALALLNDAVKKGGAMATSYVGGLSGAFIPVSEDAGMIRAAADGALSLEKLEAMTCVCSVGLDMIAIPGDTSAETIAAIIADEMAIGVINKKTTAVRIIPAPGKKAGDFVEFGGLLGRAPIMPVNSFDSTVFVRRGGQVPPPIQSLTN
ncbi:PFL family protein [Tepidanaerobacter sp. GT38]|uniref:PFL family protein n=1 Tax=Tepidanaerobacter sp. GT38 TaxID=2722793 RepID=UPI001F25A890|nr:PFL family protein [Tepidanaerobacter sp. GT38]MCG1011368.1 PFL family protein [Tepidanaerobacter sp. GT38]